MSANDFTNFNELGGAPEEAAGMTAATVTEEEKNRQKRAARKAKTDKMVGMLKETMATDPTFEARLKKYSKDVEVVNSLGFGDNGNIILDGKDEAGNKNLVVVSKIVGYIIRNIGKEPIKYQTEEFTKNAEGVWVGQKVEKVLAPGEEVPLARKWMTLFAAQPEISFELANGKIARGSGSSVDSGTKEIDVDKELEAHYFSFSDPSIKVNDDNIKKNVGKKVGETGEGDKKRGVWVVRPEYEKTFGFLNNVKAKEPRKAKEPKDKIDIQAAAANYVFKLAQSGKI